MIWVTTNIRIHTHVHARKTESNHDVIFVATVVTTSGATNDVKVGIMATLDDKVGTMGLLPDTQNYGLRMRRECWERFPRHWLQRKPLVSDPGMHHGTCVTHVPWCMSGSLTRGDGENVPGIPGACATHNLAYLVRGPWQILVLDVLYGLYCKHRLTIYRGHL